jgi:predicted Zn-dependent protease with MMP-like domain
MVSTELRLGWNAGRSNRRPVLRLTQIRRRGSVCHRSRYRDEMEPVPSAPEPVDFDAVIDDAIDDLPLAFAEQLGSVAIVVEDEPTADQLASVDARGLFGLYQGIPRTRWGADGVPLVSKITLFRGPLTRANRDPERLRLAIRETLLHEIAHHFGIDDNRLRELHRG